MFRKGYQYKMFRGLSNMILGFVFLIGSNFLAIEEKKLYIFIIGLILFLGFFIVGRIQYKEAKEESEYYD